MPTCAAVHQVSFPSDLSCDQLASIALRTLAERAPDQVRRGIRAVSALRTECPRGEMPPLVDCDGVDDVQLVTVTFGPAPAGGPVEPELTVAVHPTTGRVLGIQNPLIR